MSKHKNGANHKKDKSKQETATGQPQSSILYIDEFGQNRGMPLVVSCQTWASRQVEIETVIHGRIAKEHVQSIMVDDNTNPTVFEAFWSQVEIAD